MPKVHLFIPCLIDQLYPEMGVALVKILRHFDFDVQYDEKVTCCGQPAFNAGQTREARTVARGTISTLCSSAISPDTPIVCPSGSCTAMVRNFYPELFAGEPEERDALSLGSRVFELSEFLARYGILDKLRGEYRKRVAFHNSCHSARELGLRDDFQALFKNIEGLELINPSKEPVCCGFGGLFCQKFEGISKGMAKTRLEQCEQSGAEVIVSNDPGCIMHLRVQAAQLGIVTPISHTTELLVAAMGL